MYNVYVKFVFFISSRWVFLIADFFLFCNFCFWICILQDASGTVTKTGGNFKEKLREFGGLDAVFGVTLSCHSVMEV